MEFLLNIVVEFTDSVGAGERARLLAAEHAAAEDLKRQGRIGRMWRVPCSTENWGIWRARDATHLHEIVSSLPLFPWMRVAVHPLAAHPLDDGEGAQIRV